MTKKTFSPSFLKKAKKIMLIAADLCEGNFISFMDLKKRMFAIGMKALDCVSSTIWLMVEVGKKRVIHLIQIIWRSMNRP